MKKNGGNTAYKDSAAYTSILRIEPNEEGLHELNDYYANGNLKRHGWVKAADPRRLRFEGLVETYYDNGALETVVRYSDNQRIDTAERYYKNGTLKEREVYLKPPEGKGDPLQADLYKRLIYYADSMGNIHVQDGNGQAEIIYNNDDIERGRYVDGLRVGRWEGTFQKAKYRFEEWYENGEVIRGITTDSLGKQYPYEQRQVQPEYPEGMRNLMKFIGQNYKYPQEAIQAKVNGQLLLRFVVDTTGMATDFEVISDLGYGTAAAAIDAVRKSERWSPGYQRGVPVRVKYTLPVRLNISSRPSQKPASQ
ncbi:MAG TPA: energy transducer TonB [Sphingobacterium sp.]|nr:energy transducer TonB [Sphingobacterium sp.]